MKYGFYGGILMFILSTVVSAVRFFVFQHKLSKYLSEKHAERWKELTAIFGFGPGYANSQKGIKFLFSKDYLGDPKVLRLKVTVRNALIYTFTGTIAVFLALCVMVRFYPKP